MTRERSRRRLRRRDRNALIAVSLTAMALTASGCVVVHGEREVLPATTRAEAAKALTQFTDAYNKADKAYDRSLDKDHVTGALADIDGARLKAGHANSPSGNANHTPLTLTDAKFTIPAKAGWPRWFVADAKGNIGGANARWLLVFTRDDLGEPWQVAYLTLVAAGDVPEFKKDKDGWAEAVPADSAQLAVRPADLSKGYATYLKSGGTTFADGRNTSGWRSDRAKEAKKPGLVRQFIDQPLTHGDYAPLALRTVDGGALVFFTTHHYEKRTAAPGTTVPIPNKDVQALTKGEVKQSLTLEFISNEAALDPAGSGPVSVLGRLQGLTAAQGE
ncbi:hypothetical protein [Streptomyces diastatochromogenes]|uniref:DUF8094 domain-containing protein n=1 Tax=Streptomyces diastatochromogenes TaxID=42236 RepID=A0A233SF28_STRDA|nr:hypothetical protein [Streptomyces diastatochromogenes]MCZ0989543.1 hypothetical protein [Streptomyces diastatochromogenes]OXY94256.1 hypothetical protein BEK98_20565 [Streptomyces diastatochromogenes]